MMTPDTFTDWPLFISLAGLALSIAGGVMTVMIGIIGALIMLLILVSAWIFRTSQTRLERSLDVAWNNIRDINNRNSQYSHVTPATVALKSDIAVSVDSMTTEMTRLEAAFEAGFARVTSELTKIVASMIPRAEYEIREKVTADKIASLGLNAHPPTIPTVVPVIVPPMR